MHFYRAFLSNLTSSWSQLTPHDLWPSNVSFSGQRFFLLILVVLGHFWAIWHQVGLGCPLHDLRSHKTLYFGQGFFLPNLVAIRLSCVMWPLVDRGWPLHDLWLQQYITLHSGALPTKLGDQRTLLNNLTPGWPRLTSAWPLTPAMHYSLVRGFYQI